MAFIGVTKPSIIPATGISNVPGINGVPILSSDIVPSRQQSAYRITVIPSGTDQVQFAMTIDDGSALPYTSLFNNGLPLNPDTSYLFTHGVTSAESYNFILMAISGTPPIGWRKLQVEEVTEGVI